MNNDFSTQPMSNRVTVGLAQIAPRLGDVAANMALHVDAIRQARQEGVDLLVFPELSLTGYKLMDLVPSVARPALADEPILAKLLAEASNGDREMGVVVSFVEEDRRHRFYTVAAFLYAGEIQHVHRKVYLPTYGIFDEGRYLAHGESIRAFETPWGRAAMLVCEDFWHMSAVYLAWLDGADLLIIPTASPARVAGADSPTFTITRSVEQILGTYADLFSSHILLCNRTGVEDGIGFSGGSMVFGPTGKVLGRAPDLTDALLTLNLDLSAVRRARMASPLLRDERPHWVVRQMQEILGQGVQTP